MRSKGLKCRKFRDQFRTLPNIYDGVFKKAPSLVFSWVLITPLSLTMFCKNLLVLYRRSKNKERIEKSKNWKALSNNLRERQHQTVKFLRNELICALRNNMDFNQPITTTPKLLNFLTYFANLQKFMIIYKCYDVRQIWYCI